MSPQKSFSNIHLSSKVRNLGLSALVAASIASYALSQRPISASGNTLLAQAGPSAEVTTEPGLYVDGTYRGDLAQAGRWGDVQVEVVIENGQIANFNILDYPHSRSTSVRINRVALPYLMEEAVQAQNADIDLVSGATPTSYAFIQSLQSALEDAANGTLPDSSTPGIQATATPGISI